MPKPIKIKEPNLSQIHPSINVIEVMMNEDKAIVFKAGEIDSLFYTKGLNPCMGIVLQGLIHKKLTVEQDSQGIDRVQHFVVLGHNSGLNDRLVDSYQEAESAAGKHIYIKMYCEHVIDKLIDTIKEVYSHTSAKGTLKKIVLTNSVFIHCVQQDPENLQHVVSAELKRILSTSENIMAVLPSRHKTACSESYTAELCEEREVLTPSNVDDNIESMSCYIRLSPDKSQVYYAHSVTRLPSKGLHNNALTLFRSPPIKAPHPEENEPVSKIARISK